jgi:hypothetical protein
VGVSSTYEFLDVQFDGPVFLQDFGVYACSVSPATDNPECSALCSTPAPTTCSQPNFTCLNLTQGTTTTPSLSPLLALRSVYGCVDRITGITTFSANGGFYFYQG